MPLIYLVRHGRAAGGYTEDLDPGLDDMGRTQGFMVMEALKNVEPTDIVTSPMRRCRETALPLAKKWGVEPRVEEAVTEVPSGDRSVTERGAWLDKIMEGDWSDAGEEVNVWRESIYNFLKSLKQDTVVFSHFVAINAVLAKAMGNDKVVNAFIENGSITRIDVDGDKFEIVEMGKVVSRPKIRVR